MEEARGANASPPEYRGGTSTAAATGAAPSYSPAASSSVQSKGKQPATSQLRELDTYTYRHEIIASVAVANASERPQTMTLQDWLPNAKTTTTTTTTTTTVSLKDPASALAAVRGFADLGPIVLPRGQNSDVAACLRANINSNHNGSLREAVRLYSASSQAHHRGDGGQPTKIWTFSVYSESAEDVFGSSPEEQNEKQNEGRNVPVWKWLKPSSPYAHKGGFWEVRLDKALEDGYWNGGSDLTLLVHSVSEQRRDALAGRMTTSLTAVSSPSSSSSLFGIEGLNF